MKPTFILCTLFICICAKGFGQENNRDCIVYGPKAGFNISAPGRLGLGVWRETGTAVRSLPERFLMERSEDGDVREDGQPCGWKPSAFAMRRRNNYRFQRAEFKPRESEGVKLRSVNLNREHAQ